MAKRKYHLDTQTAAVLCVCLVCLAAVYVASEGEERAELLTMIGALGTTTAALVRPLLASRGEE